MSPPVDLENGRQREYDENTPLLREQGDGEGDGSSNIIIQQTTTPMVSQERAQRLVALDLLRGLLMVFESIDHARGFLSDMKIDHEEWFNMPNYNGDVGKWLVRFITGLCAPGFFYLMGIGIVFFTESRKKLGWSTPRILLHFLIRGLLLALINFIQFPPTYNPSTGYYFIVLTVLWALGLDIVFGAGVLSLEVWVCENVEGLLRRHKYEPVGSRFWPHVMSICGYSAAALILALVVTLTAPPSNAPLDSFSPLNLFFYLPSSRSIPWLFSIFPPIPWIPPLLVGLAVGRAMIEWKFNVNTSKAMWMHLSVGAGMMAVFIGVRFGGWSWANINIDLLDPKPWDSFINFFNLTKYPPSLAFLLCTLGVNFLMLSAFFAIQISSSTTSSTTSSITTPASTTTSTTIASVFTSKWNPLMVFGTSALFFYILHFYIYLALQFFLISIGLIPSQTGRKNRWEIMGGLTAGPFFLAWLVGLIILYPACADYARFKASRGPDSVFRFF